MKEKQLQKSFSFLGINDFFFFALLDSNEPLFLHDDLSPYGDETIAWHLKISMILGQQVSLT